MNGVNERPQSDMRYAARSLGGDISQELADDPLGKVVGFNLAFDCQLAQLRCLSPVPADNPLEETGMSQVIQPARLSISLPGGIQESDPMWSVSGQKPSLDRS